MIEGIIEESLTDSDTATTTALELASTRWLALVSSTSATSARTSTIRLALTGATRSLEGSLYLESGSRVVESGVEMAWHLTFQCYVLLARDEVLISLT